MDVIGRFAECIVGAWMLCFVVSPLMLLALSIVTWIETVSPEIKLIFIREGLWADYGRLR